MRGGDLDGVRALSLCAVCLSDAFRTLTGGALLQPFPLGAPLRLVGDQIDSLHALRYGVVWASLFLSCIAEVRRLRVIGAQAVP